MYSVLQRGVESLDVQVQVCVYVCVCACAYMSAVDARVLDLGVI